MAGGLATGLNPFGAGGGGSSNLRVEVINLSTNSGELAVGEQVPLDEILTAGDDVSIDGSGYITLAAGRWLITFDSNWDWAGNGRGYYKLVEDPGGTPADVAGAYHVSGPMGAYASNYSGGSALHAIFDSTGSNNFEVQVHGLLSSIEAAAIADTCKLVCVRIGDVP